MPAPASPQEEVARNVSRIAQLAILAEGESTLILQTVQRLAARLGVEAPTSAEPLAADTDLRALLREIDRQFPQD